MKITLSKKSDPRGPHCVLVCSAGESPSAYPVIAREILQGKARPVKEGTENGNILYRFNMKYLDLLALAFPMAELSPGITRRLARAEEKRLDAMPVPNIKIPGFTGRLYDFQKVGVGCVTDKAYAQSVGYPDRIDYLNDEMGLGKTFIALSSIAVLNAYPALIIVPNNAKYTAWAEVLSEFFPEVSYEIYDTQTQSKGERAAVLQKRADVTIVNIEAIRAKPIHEDPENTNSPVIAWDYANPELFDYDYQFAVLDEHHRVKTPYAQVTNGFFQISAEQWLMMSGTPILNRPEEIFTVLHKVYPDEFESFDTFISTIGVEVNGKLVAYKPNAMRELRDFLAATTLRRRKDQVLKDLPQVTTMPKLVTLTHEGRRIYDQIEEEMLLEMEDGTIKDISGALGKITRLKQACFSPELFGGSQQSAKVDELKIIVKELVASGEKALIFSQWERACQILRRELAEYNPAYVTGKVKNRDRALEIDKFNNDEDCHLYIGTIGANKEAINLGTATYVIFTDEGWVPADDDQAVGRSAAGGLRGAHLDKDTKVTVIALQAEDTYEENAVLKMKAQKRAYFDRTVERDAGKIRKIEKVTLDDLKAMLSKRAQAKIGKGKKKSKKREKVA